MIACDWSSRSTSRNVVRKNPNSGAVSPAILRDYLPAAAVMALPSPRIRTFCAQVQFRSAVCVKYRVLVVALSDISTHQFFWRGLARKYDVNCYASVPTWLFLAPSGNSMSQYSSQAYSTIIRQTLNPPVRCVYLAHPTTTFILDGTLLRIRLPDAMLTSVAKIKSLRTDVL